MKSVVIFGAGIAGLSAAHELNQLGYQVSVYEAMEQPGGFFRSARCSHNNMPTEYSWHGMDPWGGRWMAVAQRAQQRILVRALDRLSPGKGSYVPLAKAFDKN
ncbi:FAD-dependent oxidoreductase [Desulfotignum balticum]|uniref:FAD-dependent oxidoreductase n=1 Tax=Desulfotignum balticum TaxID=115781 RepID=UPI000404B4E0|nr:FAD-dependent oxidoreductase [Desulfotignum balticum]